MRALLLLLCLTGCAVRPNPENLTAIISRQDQYEEVKKLAHWKSIYYRPEATKYGCNFGLVPPTRDRQFVIYFDDAMPWVGRLLIPQKRGCAFAYERIRETDERVGGIGYWGLSGLEWEDRYGVEHELSHMTGDTNWFKEIGDWILFSLI